MTSSELATVQPTNTPEMGAFDQRDERIVNYLGLNPTNPAHRAMVAVCSHYGFDPVLKHVIVIPNKGVYVTRDGLLHLAHRSGQLDGIVVDQEPTLDTDRNEWVAKVSVYRKDMAHPFTFPGRYPTNGDNKKYAQEMALKAAEAHALRRAFDVTGLPSLDEKRPDDEPSPLAAALNAEQVAEDPDPDADYVAAVTAQDAETGAES